MPSVDFYILSQASATHRHRFVCRLAEKIYDSGNSVYIHATNDKEAQLLDELLWTFKEAAFIPHNRSDQPQANSPIHIGQGLDAPHPADVLINLAAETPAFHSQYKRIAEIIDQDPIRLQEGRTRFRVYRQAGVEPKTHPLK